jgi:hypothetical protein
MPCSRRRLGQHLVSVRQRFIDHLSREELATMHEVSARIADLPD